MKTLKKMVSVMTRDRRGRPTYEQKPQYVRVPDELADDLIEREGYHYVPKKVWKRALKQLK